jgi:hypothetical protein
VGPWLNPGATITSNFSQPPVNFSPGGFYVNWGKIVLTGLVQKNSIEII